MPADEDIVTYLAAALSLTAGTSIFSGPMPELPGTGSGPFVAVWLYDSTPSDDYTMGPSLQAPGSELETVQVETRHALKASARSTANAIHALLDNMHNTELSTRTYFSIDSDGPPDNVLGQDQNAKWRYKAEYRCRKQRG